jgi:micrococcal nuclease
MRLIRTPVLIAALWLGWVSTPDAAPAWRATAVRVTDGDTLWVRPEAGGKPLKIRLHGIDAPEICQKGGQAARAALAGRLQGRPLELRVQRRDDYGRTVALVRADGEDVGAWMVSRGHAWSYRFGRDGGPYQAQQASARAAARGLFADRAALEPRVFRRSHGNCYPARSRT